ncbi:hypothetical protein CHS0354_000960, partial [Potamilus streckersoni]
MKDRLPKFCTGAGEKAAEINVSPIKAAADWILEACEDLKKKKGMIINSLKVTGLSDALN